MKSSMLTATDLFCGAGGSSKGAEDAGVEIRHAANHWQRACDTYAANHNIEPDCADISQTNPRRYDRTDILIASPECTNYSPAKGVSYAQLEQDEMFGCSWCEKHGESNCPKHSDPIKRSRAGGWDVVKFAEHHRYEIVIIENVIQWIEWPDFGRWWRAMENLGYVGQKVFFNSMFAPPTPQSRDRVYIVWSRRGNPLPDVDLRTLAFCPTCDHNVDAVQVFKPRSSPKARYGKQYFYACPRHQVAVQPYYFAAFNAIDWSIPTIPIGEREKFGLPPLKPRTMERIQYGIDRYGTTPLVVTTNQTNRLGGRVRPASAALFTQPGCAVTGMASPFMVETSFTHDGVATRAKAISAPLATQSGRQTHAMTLPPGFVASLRGTGADQVRYTSAGFDSSLATISAGGVHAAIVNLRDWKNTQQLVTSLEDAMPTQVATPQQALLSRAPFIVSYYGGSNVASGVDEPLNTVTGLARHGLVVPSIEEWCFRMCKPPEIGIGMAFPPDYIVTGNDRDQVKQYGNAVTPPVMKWLIAACVRSLNPELEPYDPWAQWRVAA